MAKKTKATENALDILQHRYIKGDAKRLEVLAEERDKALIAEQIYMMRQQAGLTQKQLANLVGTTQSVISRLEDADYEGHSLAMLHRVAEALNCHVEIILAPNNQAAWG